MILNEDIFEFDIPDAIHNDIEISEIENTIPVPGPELGISNIITQLINSTYSMIEDYNSLVIALSDNQETEKAKIVNTMISNEHVHVGMLQSLLECFSPNAENVEKGEEIINDAINESLNESFGYCPSFDEWYFQETGVNTSDLDDEQYDDLWNDEHLMNLYRDFCDSYKENLNESEQVDSQYYPSTWDLSFEDTLDDLGINFQRGVYVGYQYRIPRNNASKIIKIAKDFGYDDSWIEGNVLYLKWFKPKGINESLTESMPDSDIELIKPLINYMDELEDNYSNCHFTFNFGRNRDGKMTAGIDIRFPKDYVDEDILNTFIAHLPDYGFKVDSSLGYGTSGDVWKKGLFGNVYHTQIIENDLTEDFEQEEYKDKLNFLYDIQKEIDKYLAENNFHGFIDVEDYDPEDFPGPSLTYIIEDGDWSHEHLKFKYLLNQILTDKHIEYELDSEEEPSDSDTYTAHYKIYILNKE